MKKILLLFLVSSMHFFYNLRGAENHMENKHTVIVILEAKPGSEDQLKKELLKVKKLSVQEKACLEYHIHEDIHNPARIVLYENWTSKAEHAKQFERSYIIEFGNKLPDLLAKPYEAVLAKELN